MRSSRPQAATSPGQRIYAIGDIHGRRDLLEVLLARISDDARDRPAICIFVGDYVDRGSDSKGVVDLLLEFAQTNDAVFLRGNHDQALLDFLIDPESFRTWREFGGIDTLLSYGVRPPLEETDAAFREASLRFARALPFAHRRFFEDLRLSFASGDYLFVHAGVRPGVPLSQQTAADLLWIRDDFLRSTEDFGKVVIHGHTPSRAPVHRRNRIGIDTGAYSSGRLTAVVLEGSTVRFIGTSDLQ